MQIQPLSDRVLLRGIAPENVTKSGIVLPSKGKDDVPNMYEVVAVGSGKEVDGTIRPIELSQGDKVLVAKYAGDDIELDDESGTKQKYKIVGAEYVLAKFS